MSETIHHFNKINNNNNIIITKINIIIIIDYNNNKITIEENKSILRQMTV